ncbi:MAG: MoaD/ThiS family protein [Desulfuromonadales bacterium]|nr:MoaD/ThiS family protein [Desulfuromonadales bacterium]
MQITIRFPVSLDGTLPTEKVHDYPSGIRVSQVIEQLELPSGYFGMVLLNGRHTDTEQVLSDGDVLSLLPMVDGG